MVQRKVIGGHADHGRRQHQDVKSRGGAAELKKKMMKKSASIKRSSEAEVVISGNSMKQRQLEKATAEAPVTPQKQFPVSPTAKTPNYMKSTTSSDARKERLQSQSQSRVSFKSPASDCSNLHRKGSKSSKLKNLASGNKATTASSLKTMRTLTKNPSFKLTRASVRKCSPIVLCENLESQRATCSSTLKDCKFPAYLSLNPGGTESEGTSAVKVCPYTYCSLNGHRHAPLSSLKCFLSARRRMVKAQRGVNIGCLSPRRGKAVGNGEKLDEKFVMQSDEESPRISGQSDGECHDFFVEIFCKDVGAEGIEGPRSDCLGSVDEGDKTVTGDEEGAMEMRLDEPRCDGVDGCESLDSCSTDVGFADWNLNENQEGEGKPGLSEIDSDSSSDMDGEIGSDSVLYLDYDEDYLHGAGTEIHVDVKDCSDELMGDEVSHKLFDEESLSSGAFCSGDDGESTGSIDYLESLNDMQTSADVEAPVEEAEQVDDNRGHISFGCHQSPGIGVLMCNEGTAEGETSYDVLNEDEMVGNGYTMHKCDAGATAGKEKCDNDTDVISAQISPEECPPDQIELSDVHQISDTEDNLTTTCAVDCVIPRPTETGHNMVDRDRGKDAAKPEVEDGTLSWTIGKSKKPTEESDELGHFNPRSPNFLPLEPDPEAEKVDLKHQELDERKNTEEWMVDYALRQVVAKLGPARKRKVALLVEAFEKVTPIAKYELHWRQGPAFSLASPVQACM